jgi:hypothetical protein
MNRIRVLIVLGLMALSMAACDSGIKEGPPADDATAQPSGLQAEMEKNAKNMGMMKQGRPPNAPR